MPLPIVAAAVMGSELAMKTSALFFRCCQPACFSILAQKYYKKTVL
ncbi:hypothetical protein I656_02446 [Geobacillus sp. WSUCF1]|nr:hypothetical protein I656_02446 [Geobacillus sp. WSUCF1]